MPSPSFGERPAASDDDDDGDDADDADDDDDADDADDEAARIFTTPGQST